MGGLASVSEVREQKEGLAGEEWVYSALAGDGTVEVGVAAEAEAEAGVEAGVDGGEAVVAADAAVVGGIEDVEDAAVAGVGAAGAAGDVDDALAAGAADAADAAVEVAGQMRPDLLHSPSLAHG